MVATAILWHSPILALTLHSLVFIGNMSVNLIQFRAVIQQLTSIKKDKRKLRQGNSVRHSSSKVRHNY